MTSTTVGYIPSHFGPGRCHEGVRTELRRSELSVRDARPRRALTPTVVIGEGYAAVLAPNRVNQDRGIALTIRPRPDARVTLRCGGAAGGVCVGESPELWSEARKGTDT